jgi:hypothetical protein
MLLKSFILFITVLYSVMTFRMLTVYAGFEINEELIRLELCEKRNVPDSCCRGKCYLDKEMEKADTNESSQNSKGDRSSKENLHAHTVTSGDNQFMGNSFQEFQDLIINRSSLSNKPVSPPPRLVI